jgi:hypothetical protein
VPERHEEAVTFVALIVVCTWYNDGAHCASGLAGERFGSLGACYLWLDQKRDEFDSGMQHQTLGACTEVRGE